MQISTPAAWLEAAAASAPEAPALRVRDRHLSFSGLADAVASLCTALHDAGIRGGGTLAVVGGSGYLSSLLIHSAPRLGVTLFPLPPHFSPATCTSHLLRAGVDFAVTDSAGFSLDAIRIIDADTLLDASRMARPWRQEAAFSNRDIHLIIATSGTSGAARSVMLSGLNLNAAVVASNRRLNLNRGDCWLCCLPLFRIGGLAIVLRCAEALASVLIHEKFDPLVVAQDLRTRPVTHISLVPAMLAGLLDAWGDGPSPRGLRVVLVGGGPLSPQLAARAINGGWPLCVSYGMSETASQVTIDCPGAADVALGRVGRPLEGVEIRPVRTEAGVPMRVHVRGQMVMAGYANPAHRPGDGLDRGWFETGDLGWLDDHGILHLLGRADDMFVSGGETVHPAQVEGLLQNCAGVDAVLVSARADEIWGDRLVAIYVGRLDERSLARWARSRLTGVFRPREYLRVDRLPVDNPDKPDRRWLRKWIDDQAPGGPARE